GDDGFDLPDGEVRMILAQFLNEFGAYHGPPLKARSGVHPDRTWSTPSTVPVPDSRIEPAKLQYRASLERRTISKVTRPREGRRRRRRGGNAALPGVSFASALAPRQGGR